MVILLLFYTNLKIPGIEGYTDRGLESSIGIMDISPALMDINNDGKQGMFFACDDGDGDGKRKVYAYDSDWNLMWTKDVQGNIGANAYVSDLRSIYCKNRRLKTMRNLSIISIEFFCGNYFTFKDTIHYGSRITLPFSMWTIGCRISYEPIQRVILSISGNWGYTKNLSGLTLHLYPPPKFSISHFSFLCSYNKVFFKSGSWNAGGGISLFNTELFLNGKTMNATYLSSLITIGLQFDIEHPWYLGIQSEYHLPYFVKGGSNELYLNEPLPSLTLNLGYKFNFKRKKP